MIRDITPRAPYGSLLKPDKAKKPKKVARDLGRKPRVHSAAHLDAIRQLPCLACGIENRSVAAHIRYTTQERPNPGMQNKPDDTATVPLCTECHTEQHRGDERAFWKGAGIDDPLKIAAALARLSPENEPMRAVVFAARALVALGRSA